MIGVGVAAFALVMVVAYLITKPFLMPEAGGLRRAQLLDDRARALTQLDDLDMEFETGKLERDEFDALRAQRVAEVELAELGLREVDAEEIDAAAAGTLEATTGGLDSEEIERRIAERKLTLAESGCPFCGARIETSDRFCRSCGAPHDAAETR
jgi:hypothetical protein